MDNAVSLERLAAEVAGLREGQAGLRKGQALLRDGYASVRGALSELRETQAALCEVMVASGSLSMDKLLAQMHQRRFAAVRRTHPCRPSIILSMCINSTTPCSNGLGSDEGAKVKCRGMWRKDGVELTRKPFPWSGE